MTDSSAADKPKTTSYLGPWFAHSCALIAARLTADLVAKNPDLPEVEAVKLVGKLFKELGERMLAAKYNPEPLEADVVIIVPDNSSEEE